MPKYNMVALEQKALGLFKELQLKYQAELQRFMNTNRASRRGTVWSNPNRGVHIAKSAKHSTKLDISSTAEFKKIKYIENTGRWLGNGMILLDGAFRANSVYNDYKNGGDWQRSLSTELASFGAYTGLGIYVGSSLTTALSTALILTPYGWIIAIGVGLLAGFAMSIGTNALVKKTTENIYDRKPIHTGIL
ncbi:hypothetical protein H5119_19155 [Pseudoalteromonas sp. SG45-5]|uniref:hypothetical protein n=1 Tax=unclassified Pseudoalteromonas TaxID=194690 RepID=UPI0015FAC7E8|nr:MULTISPECIES: hypothetical protein [unclassified Pseudoalteromonas]MBB1387615.1 hypothetical protein [Pseudoalteromonas sp. SG45-5]MBB1395846.1 hypothetical protein [Pseudoalteromonas sp. SG44-4]MBB1448734.1 hypothetical protein [Pseudoalteromonas sp. SG41-6]